LGAADSRPGLIASAGREKRPFSVCFGSFFAKTQSYVNLIGKKTTLALIANVKSRQKR
jgi:hypothetical protein